MTVITTLFAARHTVHVTDSLITSRRMDGTKEPLEWEKTKIVPVPAFRGAVVYWGLAQLGGWSTLEWLQARRAEADRFPFPEAFAQDLARRLEAELSRMTFTVETDKGIGLHFTAYERIEDRWIPELFLVSNWGDPTYTFLRPTGVGCSREAHHIVSGQDPDPSDAIPERRRLVAQHLNRGGWIWYNNGDPVLFNGAANTILSMLETFAKRRVLAPIFDTDAFIRLTQAPVEFVSRVQQDFCAAGQRLVGGRIHNLAISDAGDYTSTSGDEP